MVEIASQQVDGNLDWIRLLILRAYFITTSVAANQLVI
jgi:hypothetical protein